MLQATFFAITTVAKLAMHLKAQQVSVTQYAGMEKSFFLKIVTIVQIMDLVANLVASWGLIRNGHVQLEI